MFEKLNEARARLRWLHQGDPAHGDHDAVFGAIQEVLEKLDSRISELDNLNEAEEIEKPKEPDAEKE